MRALGVKRRLLPRAQHVESLLGLAEGAGVFRMQIEALWSRSPFLDHETKAEGLTDYFRIADHPGVWRR